MIPSDQPRVRGEHQPKVGANIIYDGSAPRARGTQRQRPPRQWAGRISPACAGNTDVEEAATCIRTDQPRVRGEHFFQRVNYGDVFGSAPRARGTQKKRAPEGARCRISPACAGNTRNRRQAIEPTTDQPRVRGEHQPSETSCTLGYGSAPRARGTRRASLDRIRRRRISPACAGNTSNASKRIKQKADQPRVRGEHSE